MTNQIVLPGVDKQRMIEQVRAAGLDGILLSSAENVYYASGLPTLPGCGNPILFALKNQLPAFVYLDANGQTTLFCWIGAAMDFTFPADDVRNFFNQESTLDELADFLRATLKPGTRLGLESSCPFVVARKVQEFLTNEVITLIDEQLLTLRLCKTTGSLPAIQPYKASEADREYERKRTES